MNRAPDKTTPFPPWQGLAMAGGGGLLLAVIDTFVPSGIVLYPAGIVGAFVAASIFKYGHFKNEREFLKAIVVAVALCIVSSIWAGLCRHALCSLLCMSWKLSLCKYCSIESVKTLVFIGGTISVLMGVLLSFTLGKKTLTRKP